MVITRDNICLSKNRRQQAFNFCYSGFPFKIFFQGNYLGKSSYKFLDVVHSFGYAYGMLSKSVQYDVTTDR